ncbi:MAG: YbjQ family protein [Acidimicrobiales bacterium]|nr:YbjQ family protein [Acidimicrobiales bacterium]
MLITTAMDLPGYQITAVLGEVFGLTVRSRNIGAGCIAGLRSIGGGEIPEFTQLLSQSRNEAMARMVEQARLVGGNAIVAMRFDSGAIGQWSEICAYGTAVWAEPVSDFAKQQMAAIAQAGALPHQAPYATKISEWAPTT